MGKGWNITTFLMLLDDPNKISKDDQINLLAIEEGKTVKELSIVSGELFVEILKNTKERENWPEDHCLALLVKCMSLCPNDKNRSSHPFKIIVNEREKNLGKLYDFDQIMKQEEAKAGWLSYGNLRIGQLSMNHYYLLFLQLKHKPPPQVSKKDADWYCVGVCDLTPGGKKMDRFSEFQNKYENDFGKGTLDFISKRNLKARSLIPMEPLKSEFEIEQFDKYLRETKKAQNDKRVSFSALSTQDIDVESEEALSEFRRERSDDEGETFYTTPPQSPQTEIKEQGVEEEDEGSEDKAEEETKKKYLKPFRRKIKRVLARKKELEKHGEDEEKNCVASQTRVTHSRRRVEIQEESQKVIRPVKKRLKSSKVRFITKDEQLDQKDYRSRLRSNKSRK